ncbi:MAG: RnfH family protein [Oleibacter sp.]|nr:RnfH family protein [Thalassolituus sp.]|tara:strand:+ start:1609 stop:1872 length:264 start_codon:yes stop_codon:yes gene_type:complete
MQVSVIYAIAGKQPWITLDVDDGCVLAEAVEQSGLLNKYPEIDLDSMRVGIFGKLATPESALKDGDRVEIYRPITRSLDDDDDDDDD